MNSESNIIRQIFVGVSITVLSSFLIWKLGISKDKPKDLRIRVCSFFFHQKCSSFDELKIIVTIGNETHSIPSICWGKYFNLRLDQSVNDVDYKIHLIGKYCNKTYDKIYAGGIPTYDSGSQEYEIKFAITKKDFLPSPSTTTLYDESLRPNLESSLHEDLERIRYESSKYEINGVYLERK